MTDFERLLLAKGDAQLISAFVKDYYEIISEDFKTSFDKSFESNICSKFSTAFKAFSTSC